MSENGNARNLGSDEVSDNHQDAVVPETLEGWAVLHTIFRVDWAAWKSQSANKRVETLTEATDFLETIARPPEGESAFFSLLGHKGDLLLLHFRPTLDQLNEVELRFRQLSIAPFLETTTSYISFVELGLYEMTVKLHRDMLAEGMSPGSEEWKARWGEEMDQQRERMMGRLHLSIPEERYLCFYPMNKRRGEEKNWYNVPIAERQSMMRDHGMVGRKYAGRVQQIITGSIGFDDWEWGVYLFSKDPLVFKKLIYEMRFDEATVWYGEFGSFYTGLRFMPQDLGQIFSGNVPPWKSKE